MVNETFLNPLNEHFSPGKSVSSGALFVLFSSHLLCCGAGPDPSVSLQECM